MQSCKKEVQCCYQTRDRFQPMCRNDDAILFKINLYKAE